MLPEKPRKRRSHLPASCWPSRTVIVTACDGTSCGPDFNRLSWEDEDEGTYGSTVLPDSLDIDLLYTGREDKRCFVARAHRDHLNGEHLR